MADYSVITAGPSSARVNLQPYTAELSLGSLAVGVDNIHHDVFLSPKFVETTSAYVLELVRQTANLAFLTQTDRRPQKPAETGAWKKQLTELLQVSLTRAKYEKNIELDLLLRVSLTKFLTQEIATQFGNIVLEGKQWIRSRGEYFERSESAHVIKAKIAELQAGRRTDLSSGRPEPLPDFGGYRRGIAFQVAAGPAGRRRFQRLRGAQ